MYGDISFEFVGTVSQDREIAQMRSGQDRATINVAVNTPRKNKETGQYEESTTWVRVAIFGDRAQSASVDRCRKGMPVFMRGTIQSYKHEFGGSVYTMYNFRPDIIRPLLSLDQLALVRAGATQRYRDDPPPPGTGPSGDPPPASSAPATSPTSAPATAPAGPPSPDDDSGTGYFDDD